MIAWWLARGMVVVVCLLVGLALGLRLSSPDNTISFMRLPGNMTTVLRVKTRTDLSVQTLPAKTVTVTAQAPTQTVVRTHAVTFHRHHHHHHHHHHRHGGG